MWLDKDRQETSNERSGAVSCFSLPRRASDFFFFFALKHNEQGNSRSLLCACCRQSMSCSAWHALLHVKHMSRLSVWASVNALDILTASAARVNEVSRQRSKIRSSSLSTTQQHLPSKQRSRRTKYHYSRPTSRHSGLVLEEQTKRQARRRENGPGKPKRCGLVSTLLAFPLDCICRFDPVSL